MRNESQSAGAARWGDVSSEWVESTYEVDLSWPDSFLVGAPRLEREEVVRLGLVLQHMGK